MNVTYIAADTIANRPPMLLMMPESERDRHQLENLLQTCVVAGYGRKPETFEIEHVRIELARRSDGLETRR